ncbi:PH domain-containing protein [Agrilactobacillus fermenti]|uniref:PH domain-containing protein n=1 Tax=Agrilactobacillus fermenti TaxID=2586909 RepID=UPI003A5C5C94
MAVLILGVLVIGLLVSYAQQLIKFFHFHAQRQGHQLLISQGLFSRHQTTTDLKRIQAICLSQTALRQIFHLVSVELLLAASQDSGQQKNVLAVPVIQRSAVWQQLKQLLQISVDLNFKLTQIVSQNRWYYLRNNFLWSLLIVIHMTGWRWPWGGLSVLVTIFAVLAGIYASRNTGYYIESQQRLYLQSARVFQRDLFIIDKRKIQSLVWQQSWWMQAKHNYHLIVNVRQNNGNHAIRLKYLTHQQAQQIQSWYKSI